MTPPSPGERLKRLLAGIEPTEPEALAAERRLERITTRLETDFTVHRVSTVGSHWKGTAVRRYSDVDLFVAFARDEARKWSPALGSATLIGRVRRSVAVTYPRTSLRIDKQAVRVSFEQGSHAIDVVPAIFERFDSRHGAPIFSIPDGGGGWITTAPDLHKRLVDEAHQRSGRKLKALVKMLKWWGSSRFATSSFSSLYAEWFVISCGVPVAYTYQEALYAVFEAMTRTRLAPLGDPFGISSHAVRPARTSAQHSALLQAAQQSGLRAARALEAEVKGRHAEANNCWSLVFNRAFPSKL